MIVFSDNAGVFLKRQARKAGGESYEYWTLVRTARTARGLRHRVVSRLGKLDGSGVKPTRGWDQIDEMLEGRTGSEELQLVKEAGSHRP